MANEKKTRRHCVACGADLFGKWSWEQFTSGPHKGKAICYGCSGEWTLGQDGTAKPRERKAG
jgi:hypothetical protein